MRTVMLVIFTFTSWLFCFFHLQSALDTLNPGQKLYGNGTIVSKGNKFEMGFFSPRKDADLYLGIWYHRIQPQTIVWVANRDHPVSSSSAFFQISHDGNLIISGITGSIYWSSGLNASSSFNRIVKLMDSGNLILLDKKVRTKNMWESFEHPTDTFLPFMQMDKTMKLTSWRAFDDPASGKYTFQLSQTGENNYTILKDQAQLYWQTSDEIISFNFLKLFSKFKNLTVTSTRMVRMVMDHTGKIVFLSYDNNLGDVWSALYSEPSGKCKIHNACGSFSSCNEHNVPSVCKCLPGFHLKSLSDDSSGELSKGCFRKTTSCGKDIAFLNLTNVGVGSSDMQLDLESERDCKSKCISMCPECQAYSYNARLSDRRLVCLIWTRNLSTLQENSPQDGISLMVRLLISDIASNGRACEPCGTTIIPYPLSTGPNCGDPLYYKLNCDKSNGEVNFTMPALGPNRVTKIIPDERKLIIQIQGTSTCDDKENQIAQLDSPFNVTNSCFGQDKIEVSWIPPLEPLCHNYTECNDWPHSTCNKDSRDGKQRCLCNKHYYWNNSTLNCTSGFPSMLQKSSKKSLTLILVPTLLSVAFVACMVVFVYIWKRKIARKKDKGRIQRIRGMYDSERQVKDLIDLEELEENDNEGIEVPYYDFETILEATDNFSNANKLGRGGYGPVYKGILPGEQYIAVKRLSNVSSQGLKEFKNEIVLISKLQHRNLVKLRGYCIAGEEKILLYEYMPNKSLDYFLFDPPQGLVLDWQMRFDIILGVVRGMLYLHQDSRLRVIHRDLKTSNILLDEDMKPKISDFGLAKIFGNKETEALTERIVGTYGYMAPEYALDGMVSIKSDVFSFGVVLLEILSGKKNTGFFQFKQDSSLLGHAWRLWTEDKLMDLMDPSLSESCDSNQFIRCAEVALLCIQDEPGARPTMSQVSIMLESETASFPTPKQPTFFMTRDKGLSSSASSSKPEGILITESTYQEGR